MSISSLVLEFWQFSFIRDWPKIRKSEILLSDFYPTLGDWAKLGIPNFSRMSLIKCYYIMKNIKVTFFTVSELLCENQHGGQGLKLFVNLQKKCLLKVYKSLARQQLDFIIHIEMIQKILIWYYRISSNKRGASNKRHLLISTASLNA